MPNKLSRSEYIFNKMESSPFLSSLKAYEYCIMIASITRGMDSNARLPNLIITGWLFSFSEVKISHL